MDPSKSALLVAVSPPRECGEPTSTAARPAGSILSPVKRRAEVHSRHHSDQSLLNSTSSERLRRASLKYQARRSNPRLSQEEIVPSLTLKLLQIEPSVDKKPASLIRKPVGNSISKSGITNTRGSIADQKPNHELVAQAKDSFSPQLLTEVSEEDSIRRTHSRGRSSIHHQSLSANSLLLLSAPDRETEPQERPRTWLASQSDSGKNRVSPTLSLFNLEPLAVTKSSPAQTVDTSPPRDLDSKTELEFVAAPTHLTPSKNPRPYSLYRPDLFSTFRGFAPPVQTHITVSITSPTPQKPSGRAPLADRTGNQQNSPTRSIYLSPASPNASSRSYSPRSHIPIASKYITALAVPSKQEPSSLTLQLRRQASIARLRSPKSASFQQAQPLTQWLTNLCTLNNKTTIPPEMSGTKSDSRRERDRYQSPEQDDEMGDEEGVQKAKPTASEELGVMIDDMLNDLTGKFTAITSEIMAKMDDMGRRIDNLEASLQRDGEKVSDGDVGAG